MPKETCWNRLPTECEGKPLKGPNDLTLDPEGGFYFTDPEGTGISNPIGTVHYVDPEGTTHLVAGGLAYPNGIVLTSNRKPAAGGGKSEEPHPALRGALAGQGRSDAGVCRSAHQSEGDQIDNQPDGICLDAAGNLYVAHYGMRQVQVLDPEGKLIRRYPGGNLTTSNCAFGGPGLDQLFVTGGTPGALFRLDLGVPGLDIRPKRKENPFEG